MTTRTTGPSPVTLDRRWRTGRSLGRTVYAVIGDQAGKGDELLGMMESRELAYYIVTLHNRRLGER